MGICVVKLVCLIGGFDLFGVSGFVWCFVCFAGFVLDVRWKLGGFIWLPRVWGCLFDLFGVLV